MRRQARAPRLFVVPIVAALVAAIAAPGAFAAPPANGFVSGPRAGDAAAIALDHLRGKAAAYGLAKRGSRRRRRRRPLHRRPHRRDPPVPQAADRRHPGRRHRRNGQRRQGRRHRQRVLQHAAEAQGARSGRWRWTHSRDGCQGRGPPARAAGPGSPRREAEHRRQGPGGHLREEQDQPDRDPGPARLPAGRQGARPRVGRGHLRDQRPALVERAGRREHRQGRRALRLERPRRRRLQRLRAPGREPR